MRTIQFKLDSEEAEELQIAQELALEAHSAKPSPKALFLAGLRSPPGVLKIDVDADTRKAWNDVCARHEFRYMPPVGVLHAVLDAYVATSAGPEDKKQAAEADAAEATRINFIKKWASKDADWRHANKDNFAQYADPEIVKRCHGSTFDALEFEALSYEE